MHGSPGEPNYGPYVTATENIRLFQRWDQQCQFVYFVEYPRKKSPMRKLTTSLFWWFMSV